MRRFYFLSALVFLILPLAFAQPQSVQAVGSATVSADPDQTRVSIGVTTTTSTAQEAQAQNATQATAVRDQVRRILGEGADIRTISYSVSPNYRSTSGQPPVLTGYTVTNTIEVTAADTALIVRVIDSVSQVGATSIQGLRFTIADDTALRLRALSAAAKQAMSHAQAIAAGLNLKVGSVVSALEGVSTTPIDRTVAPGAAVPTPIEPGLVTVTATVTISAQLTQ